MQILKAPCYKIDNVKFKNIEAPQTLKWQNSTNLKITNRNCKVVAQLLLLYKSTEDKMAWHT